MRLTHDEGDLGGVDTRISGWRSTKPEDVGDQDLEGVDSLGPMKDEHGLEPACGDVVEVQYIILYCTVEVFDAPAQRPHFSSYQPVSAETVLQRHT